MKKLIALLFLISFSLLAEIDGFNEIDDFYYHIKDIKYKEGNIIGFKSTNINLNGIYIESHKQKQSFGVDLLTNFDIISFDIFYNYNFYKKKSYSRGGFYLDLNSVTNFSNIYFFIGTGLFYSMEIGSEKRWIIELSIGGTTLIGNTKPNPKFKFNFKLGYRL